MDPHVTNNLRFPGQYFDAETGLHYNGHRYYDPGVGRYLTPDPIGFDGGMNLFLYVDDKPINKIDPYGLEPLSECVKNYLSPYFPDLNLDDIDIHEGLPWYVKWFSTIEPAAYTSGNDIYFATGQYDPHTAGGVSMIGHEVTHVQQYKKYGKMGFRLKYLRDYRNNRKKGMSKSEAYENIPLEIEAYVKQAEIFHDLLQKAIKDCKDELCAQ